MLTDLLLYFSVLAIGSVIFLPLHVLLVRATRGANLIRTVNIAIVASAAAAAIIVWLSLGALFSSEGAKAVACIGGAVAFVGFGAAYNLIGPASADRSVSAHIVNLIYQVPGQRMSKEDLFGYYTHADVLEKRFEECASIGVIERHGSELTLTARGRRIGFLYGLLGRLLGLRPWYLERYRMPRG